MTTTADRLDTRPGAASAADEAGDRFVGSGLLLLAALFVSVQVLAGEVIPPLAVPVVLYTALGAAVLRWRRRWLLITVVVLVTVHLLTSVPFIAAALAHPETPASFLPDTFILVVALAVGIGAIMGVRAPDANRRPVTAVAAAGVFLAVAISAVAATGVGSEEQQPGDVTVEAVSSQFPDEVVVPTEGAVLWVDNHDPFRHTVVVEGTDIHAELPGSTAVRVPVDLAPGTYRYFCDVPGHSRMEGQLVVQ